MAECRICRGGDDEGPMIQPCKCSGTLQYVHRECLAQWRRTAITAHFQCPTCRYKYNLRRPLIAALLSSMVTRIVITSIIVGTAAWAVGIQAWESHTPAELPVWYDAAALSKGFLYFYALIGSAAVICHMIRMIQLMRQGQLTMAFFEFLRLTICAEDVITFMIWVYSGRRHASRVSGKIDRAMDVLMIAILFLASSYLVFRLVDVVVVMPVLRRMGDYVENVR